MIEHDTNHVDAANSHSEAINQQKAIAESSQVKSTMSKSMHDGVEVWCDCCSCEAEPYWVEAMEGYDEQGSRNEDQS
jgi:hypothetical protein